MHTYTYTHKPYMGWLQLVGSIKLLVSFAKETYKRDDILQKRPIILSILLTVATPYMYMESRSLKSHASWVYRMAIISRLLKIIGLFCKRAL